MHSLMWPWVEITHNNGLTCNEARDVSIEAFASNSIFSFVLQVWITSINIMHVMCTLSLWVMLYVYMLYMMYLVSLVSINRREVENVHHQTHCCLGGRWFEPQPSDLKYFKNGTSCFLECGETTICWQPLQKLGLLHVWLPLHGLVGRYNDAMYYYYHYYCCPLPHKCNNVQMNYVFHSITFTS